MFNTCLTGPTQRSLTDTNGGYNLGGGNFPHHTPWPSQPTVLHFSPKGPVQSQVIHPQHKPLLSMRWSTYRWPVVFRPLGVYRSPYLHLAVANVFQILARSSRRIRKVLIMHLRLQSTPTNLMHNPYQYKGRNSNKSKGLWCDAPGLALLGLGLSFFGLFDLSFRLKLLVCGV
jgi:hypothetical protein